MIPRSVEVERNKNGGGEENTGKYVHHFRVGEVADCMEPNTIVMKFKSKAKQRVFRDRYTCSQTESKGNNKQKSAYSSFWGAERTVQRMSAGPITFQNLRWAVASRSPVTHP